MPSNKGYTYKSSGGNTQGNHYAPRDPSSSSSNQHSYHYSNINGSYHYVDSKGNKYYNDGNGGSSTITTASGYRTCSGYGKK